MPSGNDSTATDTPAETVRLSWHNAYMRLQGFGLTPDQAEALLTKARSDGYVTDARLKMKVSADRDRVFGPDEFEVGPAPDGRATVTAT